DSVILTNVNNCDSVVYLDLTINSSNSSIDTQVACDEYVWINNQTYTSSNNTDSVILTNVNNCDSVVYLDLTINSSNSSTDTVKIVDEYTWIDGVTYTESNNTAFYVDTNVFGCDSTIYLNLEIVDYCPSRSTRNRFEWIQAIEIGGLSNTSGSNSGGYGNYLSENLNVDTNEVVNLSLTPGYKRRQYVEFWSIWVDWNFDGDFSDMNELVFRKSGKGAQSGSFTVPVNVDTNDLRMRVSMRWRRNAPSCNNFSGGEVEDYLISVNGAQGYIESSQQGKYAAETITTEFVSEFVEVYPNPISKNSPVSIIVRVSESSEEMIVVSDIVGKTVFTKAINVLEGENEISISNLNLKPGMYFIGFQNQMESYKIIVTE
ncbi:MAG: GEVED domain-containing protein, partial [Flavobacteriales bacterium]